MFCFLVRIILWSQNLLLRIYSFCHLLLSSAYKDIIKAVGVGSRVHVFLHMVNSRRESEDKVLNCTKNYMNPYETCDIEKGQSLLGYFDWRDMQKAQFTSR